EHRLKSRLRCTDAKHAQRSTHQCQHDRIDPNRTRSEHEYRVADFYVSTLHCVQRRRQRATTGHKRLRCCVEPDTAGAGFEIDVSGPTAAEPVIETVSDAVNFSLRATCSGFGDEAIPAG